MQKQVDTQMYPIKSITRVQSQIKTSAINLFMRKQVNRQLCQSMCRLQKTIKGTYMFHADSNSLQTYESPAFIQKRPRMSRFPFYLCQILSMRCTQFQHERRGACGERYVRSAGRACDRSHRPRTLHGYIGRSHVSHRRSVRRDARVVLD